MRKKRGIKICFFIRFFHIILLQLIVAIAFNHLNHNKEVFGLATKSFLKSININSNDSAKKLANALERSNSFSKHQSVVITKQVTKLSDRESIKKFFKV